MIMSKPYHVIFFLTVFFFSGCDDLDLIDTTAPSIEVKNPEWGAYLTAGDYVHFESAFTDDFELATYNIVIHENFGGHAHGRKAAIGEDPSLLKWSYNQSFLIPEGLTLFQAVLEDQIEVPSGSMAGPYHFIVQAIDKVGNSTSFQDDSAVELEIYIKNDSQPVITITNLQNDELDIEQGVLFMVEGYISDPTVGDYAGIHSLTINLGEGIQENHEHDHGGRVSEEGHEDLIDIFYEETDLARFMSDDLILLEKVFSELNFILSQDQLDELNREEIDHLLLSIKAYDKQGNIAISNTDVHVHME